jgi:hypothetical protein
VKFVDTGQAPPPSDDDDDDDDVPVLTDIVDEPALPAGSRWDPDDLAGLKTALVAEVHDVAEGLVHQACRELEAVLLERVADRLKKELPELVERILREHVEGLREAD